jgi:hypothetical protein
MTLLRRPWIILKDSVNKKFWKEIVRLLSCHGTDTDHKENTAINSYSIVVCIQCRGNVLTKQ